MKHNKLRAGFTLIEILATLAITYLMFVLVYRTFYTGYSVAEKVSERLDSAAGIFNFLQDFSAEVSGMIIAGDSFEGTRTSLKLLCRKPNLFTCPVEITYEFKSGEAGTELWKVQRSLVFDRSFSFPVLTDVGESGFVYYDGSEWKEEWNKEEPPSAVGINLEAGGQTMFFPVTVGMYHKRQNE